MATSVGIKMQMDGAAQFQADLKQITQKSKELAAEMKAAAAGEDNLADKQRILSAQMDNARAKIEKLNEKYQAQKKALQETKQQLEAAKTAYGEDSDEARKLTLEVTKQETALSKTKTEINKATAELNKLESQSKDTTEETKDLTDAQEKAGSASEKISGGFSVLKGALANLAADGIRKAVDAFKDLMTEAPAFADEILTLSSQTGLATDSLQELSYMSDLVDVDVSTVAGSLKKLTKNMDSARSGTGSAADAFDTLGVSVTDANGNLRDNEDVFYDTIDALGKVQNETERDALAMNIFGKSATDLNPMIEAGADKLKAFADEAHEMGYVLDGDALNSLGRVQDSFDRFKKQMDSVKNQIGAGVAPAIERGMQKISEVVQRIDWTAIGEKIGNAFNALIDAISWIIEHGDLVKAAVEGFIAAFATQKIVAFASSVTALIPIIEGATVAQEGMNAAANSNPYVLLASVIVGLGVALISWQQSLAEAEKQADSTWKMTDALTSAAQEQTTAVNDCVTAYQTMAEQRDSTIEAGMAELTHVQTLATELSTLADANGYVTDENRARAEFILGELNGALGTEYTMNGNLIGQYQELTGAVAAMIEQKRAEIILQAQEEAYRQAIIDRDNAERILMETEQKRIAIQDQLNTNQARMNEILAMSDGEMATHASELGKLQLQNQDLNASLAELNTAYQEQADVVDQYAYDVVQYEDNMTKALNGDYDQIQYKSWETAEAQGEASHEASQTVTENAQTQSREWLSNIETMLSNTTGKKWEFKDAGNGLVQALADGQAQGEPMTYGQVQAMTNSMVEYINNIKGAMVNSGANAAYGVADGIYNGSSSAFAAMAWMAQAMISTFNSNMQIQSPSKLMAKSGKYLVEGVAEGVKKNQDSAIGVVEQFSDDIQSAFNPELSDVTAGMGSYMMPSGANSVITDNRSNSYVINVYGTEGQNVNELADAVAERIQMNIERDGAVYA